MQAPPIPIPRTTPGDAPIRLELRSNPLFLSGVRELMTSVAERVGFTEMNGCQIGLAVDEALCNVMRHGYEKRTDGRIWISVWAEPGTGQEPPSMTIVIEDEAKQVDPAQIKSRALDDIRPGGLGVHIIREVMDTALYERREPRGMRLTMMKTQKPGEDLKGKNAGTGRSGSACSINDGPCACGGENA